MQTVAIREIKLNGMGKLDEMEGLSIMVNESEDKDTLRMTT